ncbi:flagellar motor switch protein FliN [Gemmatimonas aurantiaca]|nr:flagellar motor switch protein FliN [Gemmatimonas aurantiaca]
MSEDQEQDQQNQSPDGSGVTPESQDANESQPDGAEEIENTIVGEANSGKSSGDSSEADAEAEMLAMMEGDEVGESDSSFEDKLASLPDADKISPDSIDYGEPAAHPAAFQQLSSEKKAEESRSIDMLLDVNLPISIELGSTSMSIADILALGPGSVVELNKLAGEPVEVKVNHKTVALGEVVVVDENFGVRVTQLMSAEDRLKTLKG